MNGPPVASGMGTCGLVGQIGLYTGWVAPSEAAVNAGASATAIGTAEWLGLILICFVLPAILTPAINTLCRSAGWVKDGDLKLA